MPLLCVISYSLTFNILATKTWIENLKLNRQNPVIFKSFITVKLFDNKANLIRFIIWPLTIAVQRKMPETPRIQGFFKLFARKEYKTLLSR